MDAAKPLYLELIKKVLRNDIYWESELRPLSPSSHVRRYALELFRKLDLTLVRRTPYKIMEQRVDYAGSPPYAHTMLSKQKLDNIQFCMQAVLDDDVPGDFAETGIWRGGAITLMLGLLKAHGVKDRKVWAADSFQGLPPPNLEDYPMDGDIPWHTYPDATVSIEQVRENLRRYDLLSDQVIFLKGWFRDTLHKAPIKQLAMLRLDGDMYESTMDALIPLYPKIVKGGFVIVDDYHLPACKQAIHDYREANGIKCEIINIDNLAVYWQVT
jgi:O-methyltransferase